MGRGHLWGALFHPPQRSALDGPLSSLSEGGAGEENNARGFFRLQVKGGQITPRGFEEPKHAGSKSLQTLRSSSGKAGLGAGTSSPADPTPEVGMLVSGLRTEPLINFLPPANLEGVTSWERGWDLEPTQHSPSYTCPRLRASSKSGSGAPNRSGSPRRGDRGHPASPQPLHQPAGYHSRLHSRHMDEAPLRARPHARRRDEAVRLADGAHARAEPLVWQEREVLST